MATPPKVAVPPPVARTPVARRGLGVMAGVLGLALLAAGGVMAGYVHNHTTGGTSLPSANVPDVQNVGPHINSPNVPNLPAGPNVPGGAMPGPNTAGVGPMTNGDPACGNVTVGKITAINGSAWTIADQSGDNLTVNLKDSTAFNSGFSAASFNVGDAVAVCGARADNVVDASRVGPASAK
jgi:hypothetical protein